MLPASTHNKLLLISTDNFLIQQILSLEGEGFEIREEKRMAHAQDSIQDFRPQVVLLDTESNRELATLEFCYFIKSNPRFKQCRVFILSERNEEFAEIAAFDAGADDFIPKPIRVPVLKRRISARLERENSEVLIPGDLVGSAAVKIDPQSYSVFLGPHSIHVSRKEFELLYLMASRPGKIFNRNELYEQVWKY